MRYKLKRPICAPSRAGGSPGFAYMNLVVRQYTCNGENLPHDKNPEVYIEL